MIRIGKIVATHGLQGSLVLTHVVGSSDWLKKDDVIFLELNKGSFIPFFVQTAKAANDEKYIITVEDVTVVEAAKKLIGKLAYVKEDILSATAADEPGRELLLSPQFGVHGMRGRVNLDRGTEECEVADRHLAHIEHHAIEIDIGKPSRAVPVTPPCVRVRTRRFGWLSGSSCEFWKS